MCGDDLVLFSSQEIAFYKFVRTYVSGQESLDIVVAAPEFTVDLIASLCWVRLNHVRRPVHLLLTIDPFALN